MRSVRNSQPRAQSRVGESRRDSHPNGAPSRLGETRPHGRRGVTLIELLVTILIISILAGLILGVAAVAGETAREAKTRNMVARIHTLLMEHMDTYKSRRVRLRPTVGGFAGIEQIISERFPANSPNNGIRRGAATAEARLYALRETMLMEVPDRWSDVLLAEVPSAPSGLNDARAPIYLAQRPQLANLYLRRYARLVGRTNTLTGNANTRDDIVRNQSAECLYMIIMQATGDGEARTLFGESTIGDTDGDGAPEFLDGWGNPIEFLRWAPGFVSDIQLDPGDLPMSPSERVAAITADHDPYDMFRQDANAYRIVPLIYSIGRDETSGIASEPDFPTWRPTTNISFDVNSGVSPFLTPQLTPYDLSFDYSPDVYLGKATDNAAATDNIHNHLLGQR